MKANTSTDDLSLLDQASNILNDDCDVYLAADYAMNLGAKAGAFVEVLDERFGPEMEVATPIYTTTFASVCARSRSTPAVTVASPTLEARQFGRDDTSEMTTTYTATRCLQSGLINCPASLRSIVKATDVVTLTAITIDGVAVFTTPGSTSFVTPVSFGENVHTIPASTGSPVSYIAKETSATSVGGFFGEGNGGGGGGAGGAGDVITGLKHHAADNKLAVGLGVGLGLPFLIGVIAGAMSVYHSCSCSFSLLASKLTTSADFCGSASKQNKGRQAHIWSLRIVLNQAAPTTSSAQALQRRKWPRWKLLSMHKHHLRRMRGSQRTVDVGSIVQAKFAVHARAYTMYSHS